MILDASWLSRAPLLVIAIGSFATCRLARADDLDLPVNHSVLEEEFEERSRGIRNLLDVDDLFASIKDGDTSGLTIDLSGITSLVDGSPVDPSRIYGMVYAGPYPFEGTEANYAYKRFRIGGRVTKGKAKLPISGLLESNNSEDWADRGQLCVRFDLLLEDSAKDRTLGVYDTFVFFHRTEAGFEKLPSIIEGPFLALVRSDDPTRVIVALRTSEDVEARVVLDDGRSFTGDGKASRHEIEVDGLRAATSYAYRVEIGPSVTRAFGFRTAPEPGKEQVTFAYMGDSREGHGGGMKAYMGLNHDTVERLAALAFRSGSEFLLMGGDLVDGHTTSDSDFAAQLEAWKQAMAGFWNSRPIYPIMGNHESLIRYFRSRDRGRVALDRWPYETESAEAVFAREFILPLNGPRPSDPRRPTYTENVYSFQYGPVFCIGFNNNYWAVYHSSDFGGSPEGYILADQMKWIADELERAQKNRSVRYIILYAQEPVFPNGGHVDDAMWWGGDNTVRAGTFSSGVVTPEDRGIVEVRNELVRMVARYSKVAAVLAGDEHAYHRVLIDRETPLGDVSVDDRNGNGKIDWPDETCSPLPDLRHPTWYITSGGAGAPYYSEEPTPWNQYWKDETTRSDAYRYSSQENVVILRTRWLRGISLRVFNVRGELIDEIGNLMAVK
jgi:hypothetical protein